MINDGDKQLSLDRFARFKERSDVQIIARRYADWAHSYEGIYFNVQLSSLAMFRLGARLSRNEYKLRIRTLAGSSGISLGDFLLLAKCQFELTRCMLVGSGQIPFDKSDCNEGNDN